VTWFSLAVIAAIIYAVRLRAWLREGRPKA
jgi:cytochrome oxidase assembly protein ShyY1